MKAPSRVESVYDIDFLHYVEATSDRAILDLSEVEHISPLGIVAILATVERINANPDVQNLRITLPTNRSIGAYLRQTGMFEVMREHVNFSREQPEDIIEEVDALHPIVQCVHFVSDDQVDILADQLNEVLHTTLGQYAMHSFACHIFFTELAINVVQHAESNGGYALAQMYNDPVYGPRIELAVADCGIGILESLKKNPQYSGMASDEAAIRTALEEGTSSLQDSLRGYGLHYVRSRLAEGLNRSMSIRSGDYAFTLRRNSIILLQPRFPAYQGTIVSVTVPC